MSQNTNGGLRRHDPEISTDIDGNLQTSQEKSISTEPQKHEFASKYYAFIGLIAGLMIGLQTFLFEVIVYSQVESSGFSLYSPMFLAYFSFYFMYHGKEAIMSKIKYGRFWTKEKSTYIIAQNEHLSFRHFDGLRLHPQNNQPTWRFNKFNIMAIVIRAGTAILASQNVMLIMYTESKADMNFSLISNILALTPFMIAIIFFFVFKEKLNMYYIFGIVFILSCAVLTSLSSSTSGDEDATMPAYIPVILAVVQATLGAILCLQTRYIVLKSDMPVPQMVSDCYFFEGLVYFVWFCILDFPYELWLFFAVAGLQFIGLASIMLLNVAAAHGKAAPSLALGNCSGLYALILECTILSKIPNKLQIIAFVIGFIGALMIAIESRKK